MLTLTFVICRLPRKAGDIDNWLLILRIYF